MTNYALIMFTRIPVPGKVKTRMMPFLSGEECATLQKAMTLDTAHTLTALDWDLFVFYSDEGPVDLLEGLPEKARLYPQEGVDLGERMYNALDKVLALGYQSCLLLGSDLPFINEQDVKEAACLLVENNIVFGPSPDGGYWLVGMHKPFRQIFLGQNYGTESVLDNALACCEEHGLRVGLGSIKRDIDTPQDLLELINKADSLQGEGRVYAWLQALKSVLSKNG